MGTERSEIGQELPKLTSQLRVQFCTGKTNYKKPENPLRRFSETLKLCYFQTLHNHFLYDAQT